MSPHVCPWWGGYFIDNRLRYLVHKPEEIVGPYVRRGMTVLDFGCGMGFLSLAMAEMVGESGRVIAVDLQRQMLETVEKRARRAGLAERIRRHQCPRDALGLDEPVDFFLAFYSAHEVPDVRRLLADAHRCLSNGATLLVVEPKGHVAKKEFQAMIDTAGDIGFELQDRPRVPLSHAAAFTRAG